MRHIVRLEVTCKFAGRHGNTQLDEQPDSGACKMAHHGRVPSVDVYMKLPKRSRRDSRPVLDAGAHDYAEAVQVQDFDRGWDLEHDGPRLPTCWPAVSRVAAEQARVVRRETEGVEMPAFMKAEGPAFMEANWQLCAG